MTAGEGPPGALAEARIERTVGEHDTAHEFGNTGVMVLGTPRLLAWCEDAASAALVSHNGSRSVGTVVELRHLAPAPVGSTLTLTARLCSLTGRRAEFTVEAVAGERVIGRCRHTRFVADPAAFSGAVRPSVPLSRPRGRGPGSPGGAPSGRS